MYVILRYGLLILYVIYVCIIHIGAFKICVYIMLYKVYCF